MHVHSVTANPALRNPRLTTRLGTRLRPTSSVPNSAR
jgi:hypothetical protein